MEDMERSSEKMKMLSSFKVNVLRTTALGTIEWERRDGKWTGGLVAAQQPPPSA